MRKIVFDPFSASSIGLAVVALKAYEQWAKEKTKELCSILAKDYALYTVANEFGYTEGGNVTCYVEEIKNGYRIVAAGRPVFFLEYGTGTAANTGPKLGTPPVDTSPGSFSENEAVGGKHKWSEWIEAHGSSDGFPWTIEPRAGMYFAFRAANKAVQRVAKEVFK